MLCPASAVVGPLQANPFGGDAKHVTIAGESAGSISVGALMASPLSKNLFAGAIGGSGAAISSLPPQPLAEAEQNGIKFAAAAGANTLGALRAIPPTYDCPVVEMNVTALA